MVILVLLCLHRALVVSGRIGSKRMMMDRRPMMMDPGGLLEGWVVKIGLDKAEPGRSVHTTGTAAHTPGWLIDWLESIACDRTGQADGQGC